MSGIDRLGGGCTVVDGRRRRGVGPAVLTPLAASSAPLTLCHEQGRAADLLRVLLHRGTKDITKQRRHEAVDEEVDRRVGHHQQLKRKK